MGASRGAYSVLVGKPERRRPLERPRLRWEDNIEKDFREVRWGQELDRSSSGYGQVAGCCEYGNEPSDSVKCGEFLE